MGGEPAYQNSGLRRFGTPQAYTPYNPGQFSAPTFQPPMLPPRRQFPSPGSSAPVGGLLDGGPGGNIGAPDPSTNPGLSNSIAMGLIGAVLGPAAAMAADSAGIGASPGFAPDGDGTAGVGIGNGGIGSPGAGTAAGDAAGNTEGSGGPSGLDGGGGGGSGGGK